MAKNRDDRERLKKGDKVTWSSHGSRTEGEVEKKITKRTEAPAAPWTPPPTIRSTRSAATGRAGRRCISRPR